MTLTHPLYGPNRYNLKLSPYLGYEVVKFRLDRNGGRGGADPSRGQILDARLEEVERVGVRADSELIPGGVHLQQDGHDGQRLVATGSSGYGRVDAGICGIIVVDQVQFPIKTENIVDI